MTAREAKDAVAKELPFRTWLTILTMVVGLVGVYYKTNQDNERMMRELISKQREQTELRMNKMDAEIIRLGTMQDALREVRQQSNENIRRELERMQSTLLRVDERLERLARQKGENDGRYPPHP